jgi:hypothetical protein
MRRSGKGWRGRRTEKFDVLAFLCHHGLDSRARQRARPRGIFVTWNLFSVLAGPQTRGERPSDIPLLAACLSCETVYSVTQTRRKASGSYLCLNCGHEVLFWSGDYDYRDWRLWQPPSDRQRLQFKLARTESLLAKARAELPPGEGRRTTLRRFGIERQHLLNLINAG